MPVRQDRLPEVFRIAKWREPFPGRGYWFVLAESQDIVSACFILESLRKAHNRKRVNKERFALLDENNEVWED